MDKTIILHCGAPKTGSTTFQHLMYANRDRLLAAGIHCPVTSRKRTSGRDIRIVLSQLSNLGKRRRAKATDWVRKEIARIFADPSIHTLVLSNETILGKPFLPGKKGFYDRADDQVKAIAEALAGWHVEVRFFVRDFSSFVPSWYVQHVRMGSTRTFEAFLKAVDPERLTWLPVVESLRSHFGEDNLLVVNHAELAADTHGCLSRTFPAVMAALGDAGRDAPRKNATVGRGMVAAYRRWNALSARLFGKGRFGQRMRHVGRRYVLLPFERFSRSAKVAFEPETASRLSARFKAEWAEIAARQSDAPDASSTELGAKAV